MSISKIEFCQHFRALVRTGAFPPGMGRDLDRAITAYERGLQFEPDPELPHLRSRYPEWLPRTLLALSVALAPAVVFIAGWWLGSD